MTKSGRASEHGSEDEEEIPRSEDSQQVVQTPAAAPAASPLHPFYTLPSELILDIVDLLPPEAFINFVFANYPLLHAYGLAPALSQPRVQYITNQTNLPAMFPLLRLPAELTLNVVRRLSPLDVMRFVVANYQMLSDQNIAPAITRQTIEQLRAAVRDRLRPG